MKELKISVRTLVEFILRSGDIKSAEGLRSKEAMQEGGRIHRKLQKSMGSTYRSEVSLSYRKEYEDFALTVWGRADGIYRSRNMWVIDEIKGTYGDIEKMKEPVPVHLAQAYCYAYIFALEEKKEKVKVQLRYCSLVTEKIRKFTEEKTLKELEDWFFDILDRYYRWALFQAEWEDLRNHSIKGMEFPFEYRMGQKDLTVDVYRTILRSRQLFIQAATGTGKTMSVVFPSVHAIGEGLADKIFYLTAKTVTGAVAAEAVDLLRDQGLRLKSLYMTAKEKLCPLEEVSCDPAVCERACGHFDRINDALYDLLTSSDSYSREDILKKAEQSCVCPYELQLDLALFTDMVIGDYNYAFDPEARLKRFFSGNASKTQALFLIDEAHNLVGRAKEMFSADLYKEDVLAARKGMIERDGKLYSALSRINSILLELKKEMPEKTIREIDFNERLYLAVLSAQPVLWDHIEEETDQERRKGLLDFYFKLNHFLGCLERFGSDYLAYSVRTQDDSFKVCLSCVNPAASLYEVLSMGRSTVFFSATLLPVKYYQELLSKEESYAVYVPSPFDKKNRLILNGTDVSSRYKNRNPKTYEKIAQYIKAVVESKKGKYMVYFPSYRMMEDVYDIFAQDKNEELQIIRQRSQMSEKEREEFLHSFTESPSWLVGFCVLGGIFAEGIDLTGERLIGTVIVGTGLPMVTTEKDLFVNYYDRNGQNGFDHIYRFPGMNKVQQAAGRVIRTAEDKGIILLLDDRFASREYKEIFPREWDDMKRCTLQTVKNEIISFWKGKSD